MNTLENIELDRGAREYLHYPVTSPAWATLANFVVQLVSGGAWLTAEYITDPAVLALAEITTLSAVRLLVYGPDCTDTSQGVLMAVSCQPKVRCLDAPEIPIRQGAWVILV